MQPDHTHVSRSRRWFLRLGAAWSATLVACRSKSPEAPPEPRALGAPVSGYGARSPFEKTARYFNQNTKVPLEEASSRSPLHDSYGIITPSSLHFERHHSGVPQIDPATHTLTIHGMVDRPLVFTVDELKRMPSVSRIYFLECLGNRAQARHKTVQETHGLTSCAEWTGVSLSLLLKEAGVQKAASWIVAEGAEEVKGASSLPLGKALDDCFVAYGMNGEAIRPQQGFPLRLIVPGFEGIHQIKYLRRIKVVD